eukprot:COSAG02_NODE_9121_length_2323_cov_2.053507_1_plen_102_part_00
MVSARLESYSGNQLGLSTSHTCCDWNSGDTLLLRNPIIKTLEAPSGGVAVKSNNLLPETVSITANLAGAEGTVSQVLPIPKFTAAATCAPPMRVKVAGDAG